MLNTKNLKMGPAEGSFTSHGGGFEDFNDRIKTQEEIALMVEKCFGDLEKLDMEQFKSITENKASDMLLTILNLMRMNLPCSENFYHY